MHCAGFICIWITCTLTNYVFYKPSRIPGLSWIIDFWLPWQHFCLENHTPWPSKPTFWCIVHQNRAKTDHFHDMYDFSAVGGGHLGFFIFPHRVQLGTFFWWILGPNWNALCSFRSCSNLFRVKCRIPGLLLHSRVTAHPPFWENFNLTALGAWMVVYGI